MVLYIFYIFFVTPSTQAPCKYPLKNPKKNTRPSFVMLNPKRQILSEDSPEKNRNPTQKPFLSAACQARRRHYPESKTETETQTSSRTP